MTVDIDILHNRYGMSYFAAFICSLQESSKMCMQTLCHMFPLVKILLYLLYIELINIMTSSHCTRNLRYEEAA